MNANKYREFLIRSIPSAKPASGGREVTCRCFLCPDSSDMSHTHFYFSIPQTEYDPLYFYCFKCYTGGIVTTQKLIEWNIYDAEIAIQISTHNKVLSDTNYKLIDENHIYNLTDYCLDDELSEHKLNYINNRLSLKLTYQDLLDNKIMLNLYDILDYNHITKYNRDKRIMQQLNNGFMGFISYDNSFINMRNLVKEHNKLHSSLRRRYVNYNVYNKLDNTHKFYIMPNYINYISKNTIKIRLAEGPFDILSIKYNLVDNWDNTIFGAATGKGYKGILRFLLCTLKVMNVEIHIYIDNDFTNSEVDDIKNYLHELTYPVYIHSNTYGGEKDMGVSKSHIRESILRIL